MAVRVLKSLLTVLLLANWFACTAHCQLEKTGFYHESGSQACTGSHSDSSGHDDSQVCDWVNSGGLQASDVRVVAPEAPLAIALASLLATCLCEERLSPDSHGGAESSVVPPELVHTFQFVHRTALPARAPSLAS